jgi:cysteine dioxygenase
METDHLRKLILVWTPGKESPIHDHVGSHCIMKVQILTNVETNVLSSGQMLQGSLRETQYDWPDRKAVEEGHLSPLRPRKESILFRDEVTYISDSVSSRAY